MLLIWLCMNSNMVEQFLRRLRMDDYLIIVGEGLCCSLPFFLVVRISWSKEISCGLRPRISEIVRFKI